MKVRPSGLHTAGEDCFAQPTAHSRPHRGQLAAQARKLGSNSRAIATPKAPAICTGCLEAREHRGTALEHAFRDFDGFFTFLPHGRATDRLWCRSLCLQAGCGRRDGRIRGDRLEFRSLAHLPGIKHASVFEPKPAEVLWAWPQSREEAGGRRVVFDLGQQAARPANQSLGLHGDLRGGGGCGSESRWCSATGRLLLASTRRSDVDGNVGLLRRRHEQGGDRRRTRQRRPRSRWRT